MNFVRLLQRLMPAAALGLLLAGQGAAADDAGLVAPGAEPVRLAGGFAFTEGPVADPAGDVLFSDIPQARIHKWSFEKNAVELVREKTGGANGLAFDRHGLLLACEGTARRVTAMDANGAITVIADNFEGKKLNSPNDLWVDPKNGVYFTDPRYGKTDDLEQDGMHVYYVPPDRKSIRRVVDNLKRPNGIIGTADGKILYIADEGGQKIWAYDIAEDASLTNAREFAPQGSDGMTMDEKGNVYITAEAVVVYNPGGRKIATIELPQQPANVAFGGKDGRTLFMTARTAVFALRMAVKGR